MVISISSTSTIEFDPVSHTIVMEDSVGYIPPQAKVALVATQAALVVELNPIRSSRKVHVDRPCPSETTWGKSICNRKRKEKTSTNPMPPQP